VEACSCAQDLCGYMFREHEVGKICRCMVCNKSVLHASGAAGAAEHDRQRQERLHPVRGGCVVVRRTKLASPADAWVV
jgi:hypothetical protein